MNWRHERCSSIGILRSFTKDTKFKKFQIVCLRIQIILKLCAADHPYRNRQKSDVFEVCAANRLCRKQTKSRIMRECSCQNFLDQETRGFNESLKSKNVQGNLVRNKLCSIRTIWFWTNHAKPNCAYAAQVKNRRISQKSIKIWFAHFST